MNDQKVKVLDFLTTMVEATLAIKEKKAAIEKLQQEIEAIEAAAHNGHDDAIAFVPKTSIVAHNGRFYVCDLDLEGKMPVICHEATGINIQVTD